MQTHLNNSIYFSVDSYYTCVTNYFVCVSSLKVLNFYDLSPRMKIMAVLELTF